jgi:hypothetical protein
VEAKEHAVLLSCFGVQTPPVQNSVREHWESSPHGAPGHTPANVESTSSALHSQVPPLSTQVDCRAHTLLGAPWNAQQHATPNGGVTRGSSAHSELTWHSPPIACFGVQNPPLQNSLPAQHSSSLLQCAPGH